MDDKVSANYRRIRARVPSLPAKQAILWARGNAKPRTLTFTHAGRSLGAAIIERDGFKVVVTIDYDDMPSERVTTTDVNTGIRNPNFEWRGDEYASRGENRFLQLESESTVREIAPYYHKGGASKNVAWEDARESLQKEAERYLEPDYAEYIVKATAFKEDIELGSSPTIGGIEIDEDEDFDKQFEDAVFETGVIDEAIEDAREHLARLVASA
jgi:hypothetical protein